MPEPTPHRVRILFLAANPASTDRLRLDVEVRAIDQALRQAEHRDRFEILQHWAVRVFDLQGLLLRHQPDIVHFSGHGANQGQILLEDEQGQVRLVQPQALAALFAALGSGIRLVFLNACFSAVQARAIVPHVDCVLGMPAETEDGASITFATSFYQALAYGRDVQTAFDLGCVQIDLDNLDESNKPTLLAERVDPRQVIFASATEDASSAVAQPIVPPAVAGPLFPSQRRHLETRKGELESSYGALSRRMSALDTDIGRELDSERKLTLEERRAELSAKRDGLVEELEDIERQLTAAPQPRQAELVRGSLPSASTLGKSSPRASILFDEGHGQDRWFGIAPTITKGYLRIATAVRQRMDVAYLPAGSRISAESLQAHNALVLTLGPQGQTQLTDDEQQAIHEFVRNGGGLLVLGAYTGDWHHEGNLNQLLGEYGMAFNRDVVMQPGAANSDGKLQSSERSPKSSYAVEAFPVPSGSVGGVPVVVSALLDGVPAAVTLSSCSLYVDDDLAVGLLMSSPDSVILEPVPIGVTIMIDKYRDVGRGPAIVLAASRTSKVIVAGSWKMFLDAFVDDVRYANGRLFRNIVDWLAG